MTIRRLRRTGMAFVALFLSAAVSSAQPAITTDPVPLLWRVDAEEVTLYLYGSIHIAPPEALPPPIVVREAFARATTLVTEVPMDDDLLTQLQSAITSRMFLDPGHDLSDFFSPDEWRRVERWATENGVPSEMLHSVEPWVLEVLASETGTMPEGYSADNGLDLYFSSKAKARGVPEIGLESVEDQIAVLAGGTIEEQVDSLLVAIEQVGTPQLTIDLYEAWRAADVELLEVLIEEGLSTPGSATTYERLLTERNEAWVSRLMELVEGEPQTYFVVVGAAHLIGRTSVIELLQDAGHGALRVRTPADLRRPR